jgi:hypothetical protein
LQLQYLNSIACHRQIGATGVKRQCVFFEPVVLLQNPEPN